MEKYNPKFIKDIVQKVACFSKDSGIRQHHKKNPLYTLLYFEMERRRQAAELLRLSILEDRWCNAGATKH